MKNKIIQIENELKNRNTQLKEMEQKLIAAEQELEAVNIQLEATKQQLKLANEQLKTSEELSKAIVSNSPVGISVRDKSGRLILYNKAWQNLWLLDDKDISDYQKPRRKLTLNSKDAYLNEHLGEISKVYNEGGKYLVEEVKVGLMKTNNAEWISQYFYALKDSEGKVSKVVILTEDITQRKKTEEALKKSEEKYSILVETTTDWIWELNLDGNYIYSNNVIQKILGYTPKNFCDIDPISLVHPEDRNLYSETIEQAIKNRSGWSNIVLRWCRLNCEYRYLESSGQSKFDSGGNLIGFIGINRDITKRKQAEKELTKLSIAVEQSPSIIIVTDLEGRMEYVNSKFTKLTGYTTEEVLSNHTRMLRSDSNSVELYKKLWETIVSGKTWHGEFKNRKKNGELYWESASISPLFDQQGKIINYIKVSEDVTEKRKNELELIKMEKLRGIGALAGGLAHDFNNILTGIYGNVSLALMKLDKDHPVYPNLEKTEKSIFRATQLTSQLLTFSKGGAPNKKDVNLAEVIKETVKFDLSGSNVKAVFNFAENLPHAKVDKGQMQQVFSNLTINAVQASPNGGCLYISASMIKIDQNEILDLDQGNFIKIKVQDEGVGIPQKNIDKIFDPYFTTKKTGSGLGLATTYSIIKKHNGSLEIDSTVGKGSTFTIYIPASKSKSANIVDQPEQKIVSKPKTTKILIMDDEESILEVASEMVESLGFKSERALNGDEAIDRYRESIEQNNPFDLIIMDLTIPGGMGGEEAVKKILEIDKNAKVIVSSGYTNKFTLADYRSFGFIDKVDKPYTLDSLKEVLIRVINL